MEWDHFQSLAKRKFEVWKPPLGWLTSNHLKFCRFCIQFWGIVIIPHDTYTCIKKDEDLQTLIHTIWCIHAKKVKMVWDGMYWEYESNKKLEKWEINMVINFHELKMIHEWNVLILNTFLLLSFWNFTF